MNSEIRTRLVNRAKKLQREAPEGIAGLDFETPAQGALVNDLDDYPHAFVVGCVMDRQVKAERAWEIPEKIRERVGSFEFDELAALSRAEVDRVFRNPTPLHRFPNEMARHCHSAIERIAQQYGGDASNIWSGDIGSATLVRRFLAFNGVGPKIATMAANILVRGFRVQLKDYHYIDISVDVHVKRVFQRLGLVPKAPSNFEITYAAREMNPRYPGIFDFVCWEIGRDWCHPGKPSCPKCVMNDICPGAQMFHPEIGNDA